MTEVKDILIDEYDYPLPDERIARYPLPERDMSKLLVLKDGIIGQSHFRDIGSFLPANSLLVCNETKVIHARLRFSKESGSQIEIFCLEPVGDFQTVFTGQPPVRWKCLVGNSKRWKSGALDMKVDVEGRSVTLSAVRVEKNDDTSLVDFSWEPASISFASVLEAAGEMPLPPYLRREAEQSDNTRYQTVFARHEGSVAAPTASLHMTEHLMESLKGMGHEFCNLTLHVGAGTFKPVSTATVGGHNMHSETIVVGRQALQTLSASLSRTVIPIGTTSMRTIESLYWIGVMMGRRDFSPDDIHVSQWLPYECDADISADEALANISDYLDRNGLDRISASTSLMIAPSYKIRMAKGLITNFHQPKSTLLLLVSALIGDRWKDAYRYALDNGFRFLSYGDSCLFLP